jgi:hypothetical protein
MINDSSKYDEMGVGSISNKDNANPKQLKWEMQRDERLNGKKWNKKKDFRKSKVRSNKKTGGKIARKPSRKITPKRNLKKKSK